MLKLPNLDEYESNETLPKRRTKKVRKPYAIEWYDDFLRKPGKWVVIERYKTLARAQQALEGKIKGGRMPQFRLSPDNPKE